MKILIVEDNMINWFILGKLLSPFGKCDIAENGSLGLSAFNQSHKDNFPYDLICLDIMMPEMDGLELLKQIRMEENNNNSDPVKIIMTTTIDESQIILKATQLGCNGYIIKPYIKKSLFRELEKLGFNLYSKPLFNKIDMSFKSNSTV